MSKPARVSATGTRQGAYWRHTFSSAATEKGRLTDTDSRPLSGRVTVKSKSKPVLRTSVSGVHVSSSSLVNMARSATSPNDCTYQ